MTSDLTLVLLADTHGYHWELEVPPGDLLIHAGDLTQRGTLQEVEDFDAFLATLSHPRKIVIAGNHDFCFQDQPAEAQARLTNAIYLEDESTSVEGLKIYGSPWQPWFYDWAFNLHRGPEIAAKWALIPMDTDILITHGPPHGICDRTFGGQLTGCEDLLRRIEVIEPKLHVFGHIHEAAGVVKRGATTFVNASTNEGESGIVVLSWSAGACTRTDASTLRS